VKLVSVIHSGVLDAYSTHSRQKPK